MTTGTRSWYVPPCFASRLFVVEQDSLLARSSCNNVLANSAPSCISPLFEFKFVYGFTSKDYPQPSRIRSNTFRKLSVDTRFKEAGRRVLRDGRRQLPGRYMCTHTYIYLYMHTHTYTLTTSSKASLNGVFMEGFIILNIINFVDMARREKDRVS